MKNQKQFNNFTYNTKCNIWRISYNNNDSEYDIRNYYSDEYNITAFNNSNTYKGICINELNMYYGELCTMYYVWKNNLKSDIVGFDQYRRQWTRIDFDNINKNKIQVYSYWNEKDPTINKDEYNDLGGFLYSLMLYIKFHYPQYTNKLNYLLFKYPQIKNHVNIFVCKWEIFEQICNIIFGYLENIMPNNQWQNPDIINDYNNFNFKIHKKLGFIEGHTILLCDKRNFIFCLEMIFGTLLNIISESFPGEFRKYYVLYKCNSEQDLHNILKAYIKNTGNGVDRILINDNIGITKNITLESGKYINLYIKCDNEYKGVGYYPVCYDTYLNETYKYFEEINLKPNEYVYSDSSIELHKGNYIIKNI